jgi:hypothetical protein
MSMLTAGFGLSKITPSSSGRLAGYAARTADFEGVHDELYARALILSAGERTVAMISVDVLALDSAFVEQTRAKIRDATGLVPEGVMIAATHTHGGPLTIALLPSEEEAIDPKYLEFLQAGIVKAVATAWNSRFPARVGVGATRAEGVGGNRHQRDGATDPELGLLKVDDLGGRTRAVALNYACHPTVLGPDNLRITADFPGFAVTRTTERMGEGTFAMFLNGAAGNISVGRSPEATALGLPQAGRTFERAANIGHRLADLAIEALPSIETTDECILDFATRRAGLEFRPLPSPKETAVAKQRAQDAVEAHRRAGATSIEIQKAQLAALYAELQHFESSRRNPDEKYAQIEIQCLRIGSAAFLAVPMEPFVELGLEMKRLAGARLFMIGLANGYMGYLPAADATKEHGYETVAAHFASGSDRIVVEQALELVRELFEREGKRRTHS